MEQKGNLDFREGTESVHLIQQLQHGALHFAITRLVAVESFRSYHKKKNISRKFPTKLQEKGAEEKSKPRKAVRKHATYQWRPVRR